MPCMDVSLDNLENHAHVVVGLACANDSSKVTVVIVVSLQGVEVVDPSILYCYAGEPVVSRANSHSSLSFTMSTPFQ